MHLLGFVPLRIVNWICYRDLSRGTALASGVHRRPAGTRVAGGMLGWKANSRVSGGAWLWEAGRFRGSCFPQGPLLSAERSWWRRGQEVRRLQSHSLGGPRRAAVILLPPCGMAQRLGRLLGFKPFVGLGIIFSHFDVDPLLLPLMLITRAERAKAAREDGRGADWLAWQTVLITTFMGNFRDDGLRLLITGMQIIDSKCALFSSLCGIPKAGIKKGHRRPNGSTQAPFVRHLERTPF